MNDEHHWDGSERRNRVAAPDVVLEVLDRTQAMIREHTLGDMQRYDDIQAEVAKTREASEHRHLELTQQLANTNAIVAANTAEVRNMLTQIEHGFPGDDPEGHRRYHEEVIRDLEARRKFKEKMLEELTKYGIIGLLGFLCTAAWFYLKTEIHR